MTTLSFQLSKPNAQITEKKKRLTRSSTTEMCSDSPFRHSPTICLQTHARRPIALNFEQPQDSNQGDGVINSSPPVGLNVLSSTYQAAMKSTRIALRNSFSQFNLFPCSSNEHENEFQSFRYPLEVKGIKIPKNKWTHLSFSAVTSSKEISVNLKILKFYFFFYINFLLLRYEYQLMVLNNMIFICHVHRIQKMKNFN